MHDDVDQLATFLQKLSPRTRLFFTYDSFDLYVPKVCRYGPALLDEFQSKGIGQAVFAKLVPVIRRTGKDTIILFGGVKSDNSNAIKHYLKLGFGKSAEFSNQSGEKCLDMVLRLVQARDSYKKYLSDKRRTKYSILR